MQHCSEVPFNPKEAAMNKKMPKKLVLCTETLRNLDEKDLQHAVGGSLANTVCPACGTATNACSGCKPCF
jgi:hypothetical protein